jgi:hypothetical protein
MNPAAKWYKQLCEDVSKMTVEERREFYLEHFAWLARVSSTDMLKQLRKMAATESMVRQVGAEHCAKLVEVVDGHIALREMGIVDKDK